MWWSVQRCLTLLLIAPIGGLRANVIRNEADIAQGVEVDKNIAKRGLGSGINDYGPPIHITSSVLQLSQATVGGASQASVESGSWKPSSSLGLSADGNVWQGADTNAHDSQPAHGIFEFSGGQADESGSIFSSDAHMQHYELIGVLHTPSNSDDDVLHLSDNVDFNYVADVRGRHTKHTKSYGR